MAASSANPRGTVSRARAALVGAALALVFTPGLSLAQTTTDPTVYASSALNLRKGPGSDDAILTVVPLGGEMLRGSGAVTNEYAPVTYDGVTGWVVADGLVVTQEEVTAASGPDPAPAPTGASLFSSNTRYTLRPLMLRDGPSLDAEPLTGMPEGAVVTLTQVGAENGYVTVDYDGLQGWAYADLLGEDEAMVGT
jgi:uncharacterized protein YgiM (DUF1202 family)